MSRAGWFLTLCRSQIIRYHISKANTASVTLVLTCSLWLFTSDFAAFAPLVCNTLKPSGSILFFGFLFQLIFLISNEKDKFKGPSYTFPLITFQSTYDFYESWYEHFAAEVSSLSWGFNLLSQILHFTYVPPEWPQWLVYLTSSLPLRVRARCANNKRVISVASLA